ncbi:MAG: LPP20 family lipoprotein [Nitrospirae bacterium]|nr:LPP20 family lipoprotein [Nitrospirota bacterium]
MAVRGSRSDRPPWNRGEPRRGSSREGGAFLDEKGKFFYGVGSASGIRNVSLANATAENRARNDIAKVLDVYVSSLMRDYAASTTAGDFRATVEEQHIEQAVKTITAVTLSGVMIIDRWESPDGDIFSLARLDVEGFKERLNEMKDLNTGVRDYVRENAERLHEKLVREEEKHE